MQSLRGTSAALPPRGLCACRGRVRHTWTSQLRGTSENERTRRSSGGWGSVEATLSAEISPKAIPLRSARSLRPALHWCHAVQKDRLILFARRSNSSLQYRSREVIRKDFLPALRLGHHASKPVG